MSWFSKPSRDAARCPECYRYVTPVHTSIRIPCSVCGGTVASVGGTQCPKCRGNTKVPVGWGREGQWYLRAYQEHARTPEHREADQSQATRSKLRDEVALARTQLEGIRASVTQAQADALEAARRAPEIAAARARQEVEERELKLAAARARDRQDQKGAERQRRALAPLTALRVERDRLNQELTALRAEYETVRKVAWSVGSGYGLTKTGASPSVQCICGYRWTPRYGIGEKCPRCGSLDRATEMATPTEERA